MKTVKTTRRLFIIGALLVACLIVILQFTVLSPSRETTPSSSSGSSGSSSRKTKNKYYLSNVEDQDDYDINIDSKNNKENENHLNHETANKIIDENIMKVLKKQRKHLLSSDTSSQDTKSKKSSSESETTTTTDENFYNNQLIMHQPLVDINSDDEEGKQQQQQDNDEEGKHSKSSTTLNMCLPVDKNTNKKKKHHHSHSHSHANKPCRDCKYWPSFFSMRSRIGCRKILDAIENAAPPQNKDRRPSAPFITGDGFRSMANFIFDETTIPTWDIMNLKEELIKNPLFKGGAGDGKNSNKNRYDAQCKNIVYHPKEEEEEEGKAQFKLEKNPTQQNNWMRTFTHHTPPKNSRSIQAWENYWKLRSGEMSRLSEFFETKSHEEILPLLRFDCSQQYGNVIFVQTHYVDKFIDEVLPVLNLQQERLEKCEADLENERKRREKVVDSAVDEEFASFQKIQGKNKNKKKNNEDDDEENQEILHARRELKNDPHHHVHGGGGNAILKDTSSLFKFHPCSQQGKDDDFLHLRPGFVLITHNSDYSTPFDTKMKNTRGIKSDPSLTKFEKQIKELMLSPLLITWYGQNLVIPPHRQSKILESFYSEKNSASASASATTAFPFDLLKDYRNARQVEREKSAVHNENKNNQNKKQNNNNKLIIGDDDGGGVKEERMDEHYLDQYRKKQQNRVLQQQYSSKNQKMIVGQHQLPKHHQEKLQQREKELDSKMKQIRRKMEHEHRFGEVNDDELDFVHRSRNNNNEENNNDSPNTKKFRNGHDLEVLYQHSIHPKKSLSNIEFFENYFEAKLIPIPIGIENRYNRYGKFVSEEYAAAAGCYNKDTLDEISHLSTDHFLGEEQFQTFFYENFSLPKEIYRPFVSFSLKTNKREREEAVRAVETNFVGQTLAPVSQDREESKKYEKDLAEYFYDVQEYPDFPTEVKYRRRILDTCLHNMLDQFEKIIDNNDDGKKMKLKKQKQMWSKNYFDNNNNNKNKIKGNKKSSSSSSSSLKLTEKDIRNRKILRQYLSQLKCHAFTLSPHGHGIDTHRTWEALYSGSVPISSFSAHDSQLLKQLPVLLLGEDFSDNSDSSSSGISELSGFFKKGTYETYLTPNNIKDFWCSSVKGKAASFYAMEMLSRLEKREEFLIKKKLLKKRRREKLVGDGGDGDGEEVKNDNEKKKNQYLDDEEHRMRGEAEKEWLSEWVAESNDGLSFWRSDEIYFNKTQMIPKKAFSSSQKTKKRTTTTNNKMGAFTPDYLDMSFWARVIMKKRHPTREVGKI